MSECKTLRRTNRGLVIATYGSDDFPGALAAHAVIRDVLSWPDASPGATS